MNKQPFYHVGQFKSGDKKAIEKAIRSLPTVLKKSIDIIKAETSPIGIGEVLFTATSDVSEEATKALKKVGVALIGPVDAEPGDPADLC